VTADPHPQWCDRTHTTRVHRGRVGDVQIAGHTVTVVIVQPSDGTPSVMLSSSTVGVVAVNDDDHEDMARLLELCGKATLAALVRRGAEILREVAR
jgi:hypothetical protein